MFETVQVKVALYHLPRILHILPQHGAEYHLYVLDEGVVTVVVAVQAHLVGVYHVVVIPHCYLLITHLVGVMVSVKGRNEFPRIINKILSLTWWH